MIVTTRIGAGADIDAAMVARGGIQAVAERIVKQVIGEGEKWGYFIRPVSVRVRHDPPGDDEVRMTRRYRGTWYPDPRGGCYFLNGPLDGEIRPIDADHAPKQITYPTQSEPFRDDDPAPRPTDNPTYARAGLDPERDCWVYEYIP